jgi:hypothetical protein
MESHRPALVLRSRFSGTTAFKALTKLETPGCSCIEFGGSSGAYIFALEMFWWSNDHLINLLLLLDNYIVKLMQTADLM